MCRRDTTEGTPWIQSVLGKQKPDTYNLAIRKRILETQGVSSITAFNTTVDGTTRNVKINGITRRAATNSTVDELIEGEAGTLITNGSVKDANGIIWNLPAQVTIGVR